MEETCRESIKEILDKIESEKILRMIYNYAYTGYREERAGREAQAEVKNVSEKIKRDIIAMLEQCNDAERLRLLRRITRNLLGVY